MESNKPYLEPNDHKPHIGPLENLEHIITVVTERSNLQFDVSPQHFPDFKSRQEYLNNAVYYTLTTYLSGLKVRSGLNKHYKEPDYKECMKASLMEGWL